MSIGGTRQWRGLPHRVHECELLRHQHRVKGKEVGPLVLEAVLLQHCEGAGGLLQHCTCTARGGQQRDTMSHREQP